MATAVITLTYSYDATCDSANKCAIDNSDWSLFVNDPTNFPCIMSGTHVQLGTTAERNIKALKNEINGYTETR